MRTDDRKTSPRRVTDVAGLSLEELGRLTLRDMLLQGRRMGMRDRARFFSEWIRMNRGRNRTLHLRPVASATDRVTHVADHNTGEVRPMLMFGSNSYLGLMTHPHIRQRMKDAIDAYGVGLSGSPLLNGRGALHVELEERVADLKGQEDAVLFQSGYGANLGIFATLTGRHDHILSDRLNHASLIDGARMSKADTIPFPHNDVDELARHLNALAGGPGEAFVGVEGVYSMDGDLAPLDQIAPLCKEQGAVLIVDDAHGTGVTGPNGRGTAAHFGVTDDVDLVLMTFSKTFGVTGAAVATSQAIADFMRYYARSYVFSSSIPPASAAAVLGGLEVMEREPEHHQRLRYNMAYTAQRLREFGFDVPEPQSAIIALMAPEGMDLRAAIYDLHCRGVFLNSIEYPAVPTDQQRFRISLMATHTEEDIDRMLTIFAETWDVHAPPEHRLSRQPAFLRYAGDGHAGPEPHA